MVAVELAEQDTEGMGVEVVEKVLCQQLAAEAEHAAYGTEVYLQRRAPWGVEPCHHGHHQYVEYLLCSQSPIGEAPTGHDHAHRARNDERHDADDGVLLVHKVDEDVCPLHGQAVPDGIWSLPLPSLPPS